MTRYYSSKLLFCLLISFWEVTANRCAYNLTNFAQITQKLVISSLIEDIETNPPIGKHTLRVFTCLFKKIVDKNMFRCFI